MRGLLLTALLAVTACTRVVPVASEPPTFDCLQGPTEATPEAPEADEWVDRAGRLSERAATWVIEVLGLLAQERALRGVEASCVDDLRQRGVIR